MCPEENFFTGKLACEIHPLHGFSTNAVGGRRALRGSFKRYTRNADLRHYAHIVNSIEIAYAYQPVGKLGPPRRPR